MSCRFLERSLYNTGWLVTGNATRKDGKINTDPLSSPDICTRHCYRYISFTWQPSRLTKYETLRNNALGLESDPGHWGITHHFQIQQYTGHWGNDAAGPGSVLADNAPVPDSIIHRALGNQLTSSASTTHGVLRTRYTRPRLGIGEVQ